MITTDLQMPEFIPVLAESFIIDSISDFNLYLKVNGKFILYRNRNLPFTIEHKERLILNDVKYLYIDSKDKKNYTEYADRHLSEILRNDDLSRDEKTQILYDVSMKNIEDIFIEPRSVESLNKAYKLVDNQISSFMSDKEIFYDLIKITEYDNYTFHHSINVAAYAVGLAIHMNIKDPSILSNLGLGALLHDIGKSKIDSKIINKNGPLNDREWEIIREHPQAGAALCAHNSKIPDESVKIILEHHERLDGSGYPNSVSQSRIHLFSKMVAIADSFDAITSNRPYANAKSTFEALRILSQTPSLHFDRKILMKFIELMRGEM